MGALTSWERHILSAPGEPAASPLTPPPAERREGPGQPGDLRWECVILPSPPAHTHLQRLTSDRGTLPSPAIRSRCLPQGAPPLLVCPGASLIVSLGQTPRGLSARGLVSSSRMYILEPGEAH